MHFTSRVVRDRTFTHLFYDNMKHKISFLLLPSFIAFLLHAQETDGFETDLNAGFTLTSGNSETTNIAFGLESKQITENQEIRINASYEYGQTTDTSADGGETDRTHLDRSKLVGQSNWLLSEMVYTFYNLTIEQDQIAKIDYRINTGPGFGYYFLRDDTASLSAESSVVYVFEELNGVSDDYAAFRLAQNFEYKFENDARVWQSIEAIFDVSDIDAYFFNAEIGAEAKLTAQLALRVVLKDKYNNQPQSGVETNDLTFISGISIRL